MESDTLIKLCMMNFHESFESFDCLSRSTLPYKERVLAHFNERVDQFCGMFSTYCRKQVPPTHSASTRELIYFPNARLQFLGIVDQEGQTNACDKVELTNIQYFISYCKLPKAPKNLEMDTVEFLKSPLWKDYEKFRNETIMKAHENEPVITPIFPYLQKLLSSVERLEMGTARNLEFADYNTDDSFIDVPYLILSNITSNELSVLKSLKVSGISEGGVQTVNTVAGFLCGKGCDTFHLHVYNDLKYMLSHPHEEPWLIESLTIRLMDGHAGYVSEFVAEYDSMSVSKLLKQILEKQMNNLTSLSVSGIGFVLENMYGSPEERFDSYITTRYVVPTEVTTDAYVSLLTSTFIDFVKQPQFCSLILDDSPEQHAYGLVVAFMTTPATNDQELSVSIKKLGNVVIPFQPPSFPTNYPATNYKFKSLNLGSNDCDLSRGVINQPNLELKKLHFSARSLINTSASYYKISHVSLVFSEFKEQVLQPWKMDTSLFLLSNISSLSILEIFLYSGSPISFLFPTINTFLKTILTKNPVSSVLTEVRLNGINFDQYSHLSTEEEALNDGSLSGGYDFTAYSTHTGHFNFLSSPLPEVVKFADRSIRNWNYSKDIFDFFVLVKKLQVTLCLSADYSDLFSNHQEKNLIPALANKFKGVKIKEIVLARKNKDEKELMKQIAETVLYNQ